MITPSSFRWQSDALQYVESFFRKQVQAERELSLDYARLLQSLGQMTREATFALSICTAYWQRNCDPEDANTFRIDPGDVVRMKDFASRYGLAVGDLSQAGIVTQLKGSVEKIANQWKDQLEQEQQGMVRLSQQIASDLQLVENTLGQLNILVTAIAAH